MASFGNGYGSECHLLRYLGRHRERLDEAVREATGAGKINWLDFPFVGKWPQPTGRQAWPDAEWLSLDFLPQDSEVVQDWRERWPHGSGVMNWDAVGQAEIAGTPTWLIVEAKAHLGEIRSNCSASSPRSLERIETVLGETKVALGVAAEADWLKGYYQYANRLAILHHLTRHGIEARLLFIYFCGDVRPDGFVCPSDAAGWAVALSDQDEHLSLPKHHPLASRIQKLFLPVWMPV